MTDVTAALEDAILLGVDAANLSLGTSCGSVTGYTEITAVFNAALDAGINVAVAAGNDANSTNKSLWNNDLGLAGNPDIGVLQHARNFRRPDKRSASADNSTYLAGFASKLDYFTFSVGANRYNYQFLRQIPYAYRFGAKLGGDWEYVSLDTGAETDYEGVDVSGKLVLAKLSAELSINEQGRIAQSHGAVGLILYPATNAAGNFKNSSTRPMMNTPSRPWAWHISTATNLANSIIPDTIHVQSLLGDPPRRKSDFPSPAGVQPMNLPQARHYGDRRQRCFRIQKRLNRNFQRHKHGFPAIAGISVLVRQYLKSTTNLSGRELAAAVDKLMMSSASLRHRCRQRPSFLAPCAGCRPC